MKGSPRARAADVKELAIGSTIESLGSSWSPPYSVEIETEEPGGLRRRVRVEGQDSKQCMGDALAAIGACAPEISDSKR